MQYEEPLINEVQSICELLFKRPVKSVWSASLSTNNYFLKRSSILTK